MTTRSGMVRACARVVAVAVLGGVGGLAAQDVPDVRWRDIQFRTRTGDTVPAQLGEFEVPARWSAADGPTLPLRFVRLPARSDRPGPPIVVLAGGPGASGIAMVAGGRWPLFDSLRNVADVIALDQRGTGGAHDLPQCTTGELGDRAEPSTRASLSRALEAQARHCRAFWEDAGVDLGAYTTVQSAADIDALRRALGAPSVDLWAASYGTHLALATLKLHPDAVRRAVLVSAEGLDHTVKSPAGGDRFFERVQASIDEDPAARARYPDVVGMIGRVLSRIEREPVTVRVSTPDGEADIALGAFEIRRLTADRISDPQRTALILDWFHRADQGDWTGFGSWAQRVTGEPIHLSPMPLAMDVASGASAERRARVANEARTALLGDALGWPVLHVGAALSDLDLGDAYRSPFRSDHEVLLVSGLLDGRTYVEEHREIAGQFADPVHVLVENAGHGTVLDSDDVREAMETFYRDGAVRHTTFRMPTPEWLPQGGAGG